MGEEREGKMDAYADVEEKRGRGFMGYSKINCEEKQLGGYGTKRKQECEERDGREVLS